MIPVENLLAFAVASVILVAIPGPSVLFVIGRSSSQGRRAGVLSVLGNAAGTVPAAVAVALGVGAIVAASAVALTAIKVVGGAYLIWLGVQAIRHRHEQTRVAETHELPTSGGTLFRQGFVVGATNPKSIAFFVAVLPQFVAPSAGPAWAQMLALAAVFVAVAVISDGVWALAAGAAREWFGRSPRRISAMSGAGGAMMIGLGGALAFSGSKN